MKKKHAIFICLFFYTFVLKANQVRFLFLSEAILKNTNKQNDEKTEPLQNAKTEKTTEAENSKISKSYSTMFDKYVLVTIGEKWFYEKYNDNGQIVFKKWFDKDQLIKDQKFFYENKHLLKIIETTNNKTANTFYDKNKNIIKIEVIEMGISIVTKKTYNDKNLLIEVENQKDKKKTLQKFFYKKDNSLLREENYEDGVMVSKIEYLDNKKQVEIYQNGLKIKAFDDER